MAGCEGIDGRVECASRRYNCRALRKSYCNPRDKAVESPQNKRPPTSLTLFFVLALLLRRGADVSWAESAPRAGTGGQGSRSRAPSCDGDARGGGGGLNTVSRRRCGRRLYRYTMPDRIPDLDTAKSLRNDPFFSNLSAVQQGDVERTIQKYEGPNPPALAYQLFPNKLIPGETVPPEPLPPQPQRKPVGPGYCCGSQRTGWTQASVAMSARPRPAKAKPLPPRPAWTSSPSGRWHQPLQQR